MNQILSVESPEQRKSKSVKTPLHSILVVFSIFLIIFGIGITSTGAYGYYKNLANNSNGNMPKTSSTKPVITIERENASKINIVVTHDKEISTLTYSINDEQPVEIDANNQNEFQYEITLPAGVSNINIIAEDINGITSSRQSTYEVDAGPTIQLSQVENKIQITTESEENIDYIKYYWDNDEDNALTYKINDVKNVTLVDVIEGTHTLNIQAVDIQGKETVKTQKIIGDVKPTLNITTDGQKFYIKAEDDEGLSKIEYKLNGEDVVSEQINGKEYEKSIDLQPGINKLTVRVYNQNDINEVAKVKYTKE